MGFMKTVSKEDIEKKKMELRKKTETIVIGIPCGDVVQTDFAMCLTFMVAHSLMNNVHVALVSQKSSLVEVGRNNIVAAAKQLKATKIFFLDTDMTFPDNILLRLLAHDKDIVCCDAVRRRPPYTTVVEDIDGKPIDHVTETRKLVELKGVTTAVALIDMKVFDAMKAPYFHVDWKGENSFLGEDYFFSHKAKELGFSSWCDVENSQHIGHIGTSVFRINKKDKKLGKVEEVDDVEEPKCKG